MYNALKKQFEDILKNGREIGGTVKPFVKFCVIRTQILDNFTSFGGLQVPFDILKAKIVFYKIIPYGYGVGNHNY